MNKHIKKEHPRKTAKTPRGQKTALETSEIAHQNKDISSKVLAEYFKGKTFKVYGLDLPEISHVGPTNIPAVKANELRLDNLFELADHSVAIVDYESKYKKEDKIKYLNYLTGIANRYQNEKKNMPSPADDRHLYRRCPKKPGNCHMRFWRYKNAHRTSISFRTGWGQYF